MVLELLALLLSQPHITCIDETLPAPPAHPFAADAQLRSVLFGKHLDVSLPLPRRTGLDWVDGWQGQRGWNGGHFKERNVSNLDAMYAAWDRRATTLRVPPIVHQSWKSCEPPADQARWRARCGRVLPANWTMRLVRVTLTLTLTLILTLTLLTLTLTLTSTPTMPTASSSARTSRRSSRCTTSTTPTSRFSPYRPHPTKS